MYLEEAGTTPEVRPLWALDRDMMSESEKVPPNACSPMRRISQAVLPPNHAGNLLAISSSSGAQRSVRGSRISEIRDPYVARDAARR